MSRVIGLVVAAAVIGLLVYGLAARSPDTSIDDALARNKTVAAPELVLDVLTNGEPGLLARPWNQAARDGRIDLKELRGTPVVVNIWASWCEPWLAEAAALERAWRQAGQQGVLFLGLNMQDVRSDALRFIRWSRQSYPSVRDPTNQTSRRWGATGIPETFFVSSGGDVVGHAIGTVTDQQLAVGVAAARAGHPPVYGDSGIEPSAP